MENNDLIAYLKEYYPCTDNNELTKILNIPLWKLRRIVSRNKIYKSPEYLHKQHAKLMHVKKQKYLASIPELQPTSEQVNIIVGSILGDGGLDYSPRSKNAYYREHFSTQQREYRIWKAKKLANLGFKITKNNHLKGPSHPFFTELSRSFYPNGRKEITKDNIKLLSMPIGLACLYFDDGTLVINIRQKKKTIDLNPRITLSSHCFTQEENIILSNHLKEHFELDFNVKKVPFGHGYCLDTGKGSTIAKLLELVRPFAIEIPCMQYKVELENRYFLIEEKLTSSYKNKTIKFRDLSTTPNNYSLQDETKIITWKKEGMTDKQIAEALGRNYWGIVDKIRRLRKEGRL